MRCKGSSGSQTEDRGLVAERGAPADDELLQLRGDRLAQRRGLEVLQTLLVDLGRAGGGVLAPVAGPPLEVLRRAQERAVEAGPEPLHRVHRTEEVPAVADLLVGPEGQRVLVDLER